MQSQREGSPAGSTTSPADTSGTTMDLDSSSFQECLPETEDPSILAFWIAHTIANIGRCGHASHFDTTQLNSKNGRNYPHGRGKRKAQRASGRYTAQSNIPTIGLSGSGTAGIRRSGGESRYQNPGRHQALAYTRPKLPIALQNKFKSADEYFKHEAHTIPLDKSVADARRLIANVLFPLFKPCSNIKWKSAMTSFIESMKGDSAGSLNFTMAFTILAQDKELLDAVELAIQRIESDESLFHAETDRVNGQSESPTGKLRFIPALNELGEKQSSTVSSDSFIYHGISHLSDLSQRQHSTFSSPYQNFSKNQDTSLNSSTSLRSVSNSLHPHPPISGTDLKPPPKGHQGTGQPSPLKEMARSSSRVRKPTLRAMEADLSILGKGKRKRPRKFSPARKGDTGAGASSTTPKGEARDQIGDKVKPASPCHPRKEIERAASQLLRLAIEAMEPGFKPEVEVDLVELRRQFYAGLEARRFPGDLANLGRLADPSELDRPDLARPYTSEDGCVHTGRVNEHGEEFVKAPAAFSWWRPEDVYKSNAPGLRPPPPRVRACRDIERDSVYGFPPPIGQPNLP